MQWRKSVVRTVSLGGEPFRIDLASPIARFGDNPILCPEDVNGAWCDPGDKVVTVHNAGVAKDKNETVLLFRAHLRSGVSVLGSARSQTGYDKWKLEDGPSLKPATAEDEFAEGVDREQCIESEGGGVEDPRISKIGETYVIVYSAYHARIKNRVRVSLATTGDFKTFVRYGALLEQDSRNVALFDRPVNGQFTALFRPNDTTEGDVGGSYAEIRLGFASHWRGPWALAEHPILRTGGGPGAFQDKVGPGAPPLETPHGWLNIFHGVRTTMDGNPYVLGVALHDKEMPEKVRFCRFPVLFPSRADCRVAETHYVHVPNVVFTCGALRREDGAVLLYYGGNDTVMNLGISHEDVLAEMCRRYPME